MWATYVLGTMINFDLALLGIYPRTFLGMSGILFAPMIHGSVVHLISNTLPLLFLGTILFMFYDRIARRVFFQCYFFTNILVWIFARPSFHIGASGLVYGLAAFLISFGIFKKDFRSLIISIIILILYGSLIYGVLPISEGVSWESHLMGALIGIGSASQMSRMKYVSTGP
ncbi:MAG: rhomboid family intramembrane serine protease [Cyclobacteriaceae bacterium]|nr:rhomboid family intramembrane serine protease [Cyclobacteriaceae bacterium]